MRGCFNIQLRCSEPSCPSPCFSGWASLLWLRNRCLTWVFALALLSVLMLANRPVLHAQSAPNIIFILADDLGYASLGATGQAARAAAGLPALQTPNLDSMAARGMRFTDHYAAAPTCAPARASLLTGLHTGHVNIRANRGYNPGNEPLDSIPTLASVLQTAGYRTAAIGKWGLGGEASQQFEAHPLRRGFDQFFGVLDQTQCHQQYLDRVTGLNPDGSIWRDYDRVKPGVDVPETYANNLFGSEAVRVIDDLHDEGPFFLYLSLTTPHARMEAPPAGLPLFADTSDWPDHEKAYAAMVASMDHQVGRVLRALDSLGIADQTLVLFSSDNGPHDETGSLGTTPVHDWEFFDENAPHRGRKRQLLEGGIRVPLLACWPGTVSAASVSDLPCAAWDFLPTFAELSGAALPPALDGLSFVPTLIGVGRQQRHFALYFEFEDLFLRQAVRMGPWKALRNGHTAHVQLYYLPDDPGETLDRARDQPGLAATMADYMLCMREPSADFPSPIDGWVAPDCVELIAALEQPAADSRVVQPVLAPMALVFSAAALDERPVSLQVFALSEPEGEVAVSPSDDGRWQAAWSPADYGMQRFRLRVTHPDEAFREVVVAFELAACPLVAVSPAGWTVSAVDSEETDAAPNQAFRAFDGNPATFWHTQWSAADPPHPHFLEVDLGAVYRIGGFDYLPRQGSSENGIIADYALMLGPEAGLGSGSVGGSPGASAARVAAGHWAWTDERPLRILRFTARDARFFRLEAYSEINGGPWTSAAELTLWVDSCVLALDTVVAPPPVGLEVMAGAAVRVFPNPVGAGEWVRVTGLGGGVGVGGSPPGSTLDDWRWVGVGGASVRATTYWMQDVLFVRAPGGVGAWMLTSGAVPEGHFNSGLPRIAVMVQ